VLVSIVTYNSARDIEACLESIRRQTWQNITVCVWDNASSDRSAAMVRENADLVREFHISGTNVGFCAAHNRQIEAHAADYVLALNPDVVLDCNYIKLLVEALEADSTAGSATGKLWRRKPGTQAGDAPEKGKILDTTGMYFTPNQRHLDRGSEQPDTGQYDRRQYVFGASGAAALYRRIMLENVRFDGQYFDEAFFAYREDADLAWRAQWLGWRCLYIPEAYGFHVRKVLPERRSTLPAEINMHSFKNRFLLRIKNMDAGTWMKFIVPITLRDLQALGYVLLREPRSLQAFPLIVRHFPKAWAARRRLWKRRQVPAHELRSWFANDPVARDIPSSRSD
jgi:GT2 family glycosyltransferase